ncbi:MAG TPA: hypothetical protein VFN78_11840 [Ktedonobacterales bacterium]|nr:hypothetical protein [Ktedonobacterales bacterium]
MRLTVRDGIATLLLVAIAIPYIGYLINGSMPFIQDPTGMAATGLILGAAAALVGGWIVLRGGMFVELTTVVVGVVAAALGIGALLSENLFDPMVREIVLGGFMAAIVVLWGFALLRHGGVVPSESVEAGGVAGRHRLGHI